MKLRKRIAMFLALTFVLSSLPAFSVHANPPAQFANAAAVVDFINQLAPTSATDPGQPDGWATLADMLTFLNALPYVRNTSGDVPGVDVPAQRTYTTIAGLVSSAATNTPANGTISLDTNAPGGTQANADAHASALTALYNAVLANHAPAGATGFNPALTADLLYEIVGGLPATTRAAVTALIPNTDAFTHTGTPPNIPGTGEPTNAIPFANETDVLTFLNALPNFVPGTMNTVIAGTGVAAATPPTALWINTRPGFSASSISGPAVTLFNNFVTTLVSRDDVRVVGSSGLEFRNPASNAWATITLTNLQTMPEWGTFILTLDAANAIGTNALGATFADATAVSDFLIALVSTTNQSGARYGWHRPALVNADLAPITLAAADLADLNLIIAAMMPPITTPTTAVPSNGSPFTAAIVNHLWTGSGNFQSRPANPINVYSLPAIANGSGASDAGFLADLSPSINLNPARLAAINAFITAINNGTAGVTVDATGVTITATDIIDVQTIAEEYFVGQVSTDRAGQNQGAITLAELEFIAGFRGVPRAVYGTLNVAANNVSNHDVRLIIENGNLSRPPGFAQRQQTVVIGLENANADGWSHLRPVLADLITDANGLEAGGTGAGVVAANWMVNQPGFFPIDATIRNTLHFRGVQVRDVDGLMDWGPAYNANDWNNDATTPLRTDGPGGTIANWRWVSVPMVITRMSPTEIQIVYLVNDANNPSINVTGAGAALFGGGGFLFVPLFFTAGGDPGSERLVFGASSQVVPNTSLPIQAALLGNRVETGGTTAGHPVNALMRQIDIIENQPGALVMDTGAARIGPAVTNQGVFRISIDQDFSFANHQAFNFTWTGVRWPGGSNPQGATTAGTIPTIPANTEMPANVNNFRLVPGGTPNTNQVFASFDTALQAARGQTLTLEVPNGMGLGGRHFAPEGMNSTAAIDALIRRLRTGEATEQEIRIAFSGRALTAAETDAGFTGGGVNHQGLHIAYLTQPTGANERQELVIVMGNNAGDRQAGILARLHIGFQQIGGLPRATITHRNFQQPRFGDVVARISGEGLPTAAWTGTVATLGQSGMVLETAPNQAPLPGSANGISQLVAGRVFGNLPNETTPTRQGGTPLQSGVTGRTAVSGVPAPTPDLIWRTLDGGTTNAAARDGSPRFDSNDLYSITGRVRLRELVPMSAPGFSAFEFILTDAEGERLPEAKIAAVQINTNPIAGANQQDRMAAGRTYDNGIHGAWENRVASQVPLVTARHNGTTIWAPGATAPGATDGIYSTQATWNHVAVAGSPGLSGNAMLEFSEDGHSMTISGVSPDRPGQEVLTIDVRFWISTDPGFTGDVFVTVGSPSNVFTGFDTQLNVEGNTHKIAEVRQIVDVTADSTPVNIGFGRVPVGNVRVIELEHGALRQNALITLALTENLDVASWASGINFWPVLANQVSVEGHSVVSNLPMIAPTTGTLSGQIDLTVNRPSREQQSTVTVSGLETRVDWTVPFVDIALVARGSAILNNDHFVMNSLGNVDGEAVGAGGVGGIAGRMLSPRETGFRRYGFTGIAIEGYLDVITPGHGEEGVVNRHMVGVTPGSATVSVDGEEIVMTNVNGVPTPAVNVDGRVYVPLRGLANMLGIDNEHIQWVDTPEMRRVIIVTPEGSAFFDIGRSVYRGIDGVDRAMDATPFIDGALGATYVPFRFVAYAFGIPVGWDGTTAWFNNPDVITD